ncbi:MAG: hypothetical protein NTY50_13240 [Methylobacter sp.]|nr:hypothetical protein [Methylobacter sp.]
MAKGISEMRIHYGAGYRLYFMKKGFEIVLLLADGDNSTQADDIQTAVAPARKVKEEQ